MVVLTGSAVTAIHIYNNCGIFSIRQYIHKGQPEQVRKGNVVTFASPKAMIDEKIAAHNSHHHEEKAGTYFGFGNKLVTISLIVLKATSTRPCFSSGAN